MKIKLCSSLLLVFLLLAPVGDTAAQSPTAVISAGSGSGNPGDTNISVPVSLISQDGAQVAGLNFDLSHDDSQLNVNNVTIGSAASGAGKVMSWSQPSSDTVRVIIFGLNQDVIHDGPVANVIFDVLIGAAPGTSLLTLSNPAATDPSGNPIGVKLNNGSFTVLSAPVTNTPTSTPTDTPVATSTSTLTPTLPATSTMAPSVGPSPTGGSSATPRPTKTNIPFASATSEFKPTSSVTPTPIPTVSPEVSTTQTSETSASPTSPLEGEILKILELAVRATGTALAEFEEAVAATATALSTFRHEPTAEAEAVSGLSRWLRQWGDTILIGGVALGATLLVTSLIYEVWRRKISEESRKRIY